MVLYGDRKPLKRIGVYGGSTSLGSHPYEVRGAGWKYIERPVDTPNILIRFDGDSCPVDSETITTRWYEDGLIRKSESKNGGWEKERNANGPIIAYMVHKD